jgi:Ca2+/Na+ antiporter
MKKEDDEEESDEEVDKIIAQASDEEEVEGDKEREMREGNISLILNDYDDIFSDFDPRSYSERSLSDDFIYECKKATRERKETFELRLLMPKNKRNINHESKIKKRLKDHFQKHFKEKEDEIRKTRREGFLWVIIGVILILISTLLLNYESNSFIFRVLFIISEPAGWFTMWNGFERMFVSTRKESDESEFNKKMANVKIYFLSY